MKGDQFEYLMPHRSTGYIVGARFWKVKQYVEATRFMPMLSQGENEPLQTHDNSTFQLRSIIADYKWPKDKPATADTPIREKICGRPFDRSDLGIFAFTVRELGRRMLDPAWAAHMGDVIGLVALWGDVIEHYRGYRASHAYPLCLSSRFVAEAYKVPYLTTMEWQEYLNSNKGKHLNDPTTLR
ncbi:hypothetical protein LCGC14_1710580 [marine sediment metagenome]|uniref:Uncharacterized protein n=1 Tax=marine sediment metagenome TaxID=412755 RepID=A0A0F9HFU9_9ZZZZ